LGWLGLTLAILYIFVGITSLVLSYQIENIQWLIIVLLLTPLFALGCATVYHYVYYQCWYGKWGIHCYNYFPWCCCPCYCDHRITYLEL
jgi:hypothetical protein